MDIHSLRNIDNQLNVGVVVVIRTTGHLQIVICQRIAPAPLCLPIIWAQRTYLDVLIRHPNVIRIGVQIFRSCHHRELDGTLVAKRFVGPFSYGTDFFNGGNTVVGNENLRGTTALDPFNNKKKKKIDDRKPKELANLRS